MIFLYWTYWLPEYVEADLLKQFKYADFYRSVQRK